MRYRRDENIKSILSINEPRFKEKLLEREKNYGREGAAIIIDNCQLTIAGGFAPGSESADMISKALGSDYSFGFR